jgi:hypothetical protein
MNLFGYEIRRKEDKEEQPKSFAAPLNDDGAVNVESTAVGGAYGYFLDIEGSAKTESELVTRYRSMALQPEVQQAVDEIVNEAINIDYNEQAIEIVLEDTELPDKVKETITEEFENILRLLDFSNQGYEIFQRYFVDGRINYHVIIDEKNLKKGIQELRYLDPRKIRLIRENDSSQVDKNTGVPIRKIKKEYYMYSESGFGSAVSKPGGDMQTHTGYKIAKDSIARVTSGLMNETQSLVLSHLHRAIKPLNQLRILEDATVIYTLTRAPERRIFYVDVGNLPKAKAEQYLADMMARHKNKLSYNSSTGEVGDQRKFMCYDLSTKIPLLDGRTLELRELIEEHNAGKENWVYSCDPKTGKFYPGPVSWAGITKTEADVVKVTFDNGKHVVCTPDHKFPVWGKGFIEAQHLTPDDSIIPGYRRKAKVTENTTTEYEQIYKNETGKWEFTHREVTRWKDEVGLREEFIHNDGNASMKKGVVHHKNFKPYDNNPSNLVMMNHKDHMEYHREINSILYNAEIYDIVEECAIAQYSIEEALSYINEHASIIESWRMENTGRHISGREPDVLSFTYKDLKRISSFMGYKDWRAYRREFETFDREDNGRKVRNPDAVKKGSSEHYQRISNAHKGKVYSSKTWKVASPDGQTFIIENLSDYCRENGLHRSNIKRDYGSKGYKAEILKNHRITSVEKLDDKRTVGSISVDNNETYHSHHTYLLDAGVYTKNTMTEDFWFPRREGSRATEIEQLPGASGSLMDNENLSYFQRKLYKSLGVPVSRLEPENMYSFGRVSEMTRDELRFSKFVRRLRVRFSILFDVVLEKQLVLKGILTPEEWKDIRDLIRYDFMKDNYFEELKQMEILREKISTLRDIEENVGRYFSREWVQKNVLFMNEDDIKEMQKVIDKERKAGVYKDPDEIDDIDDSGDDFEDEPPTPPLPSADDQGEQPPLDDGDGQEAEESLLINNTNKFQKYKQSRRKQK